MQSHATLPLYKTKLHGFDVIAQPIFTPQLGSYQTAKQILQFAMVWQAGRSKPNLSGGDYFDEQGKIPQVMCGGAKHTHIFSELVVGCGGPRGMGRGDGGEE